MKCIWPKEVRIIQVGAEVSGFINLNFYFIALNLDFFNFRFCLFKNFVCAEIIYELAFILSKVFLFKCFNFFSFKLYHFLVTTYYDISWDFKVSPFFTKL